MSNEEQEQLTPAERWRQHRVSLNRFGYRKPVQQQPEEPATEQQPAPRYRHAGFGSFGGKSRSPWGQMREEQAQQEVQQPTAAKRYRVHKAGGFTTLADNRTKDMWKKGRG